MKYIYEIYFEIVCKDIRLLIDNLFISIKLHC